MGLYFAPLIERFRLAGLSKENGNLKSEYCETIIFCFTIYFMIISLDYSRKASYIVFTGNIAGNYIHYNYG